MPYWPELWQPLRETPVYPERRMLISRIMSDIILINPQPVNCISPHGEVTLFYLRFRMTTRQAQWSFTGKSGKTPSGESGMTVSCG